MIWLLDRQVKLFFATAKTRHTTQNLLSVKHKPLKTDLLKTHTVKGDMHCPKNIKAANDLKCSMYKHSVMQK